MKKFIFGFLSILIISTCAFVFADDSGYSLEFEASEAIFKGEPTNANMYLIGKDAPEKTNVRIKVEIAGPAVPKLMATDSEGQEWDIAEVGYWGSKKGSSVSGTFKKTTKITATFPEAGLYEITLSLIDVTGETTITSSTSSVYVYKDEEEYKQINGEEVNNNVISNNTISNSDATIPKTGSSFGEYLVCSIIVVAIIVAVYTIIKKYHVG